MIVRKLLAAIAGFVGVPLLVLLPVLLPMMEGASGENLARLQVKADFVIPAGASVAIAGLFFCWILRRRFFESYAVAALVGLGAGSIGSLCTYALWTHPIIRLWPIFTMVPLGLVSAEVALLVAARFDGRLPRSGEANQR